MFKYKRLVFAAGAVTAALVGSIVGAGPASAAQDWRWACAPAVPCFFEHSDYSSSPLSTNIPPGGVASLTPPWNNAFSSINNPARYGFWIYDRSDGVGVRDPINAGAAINNLGFYGWNDRISSLRRQ